MMHLEKLEGMKTDALVCLLETTESDRHDSHKEMCLAYDKKRKAEKEHQELYASWISYGQDIASMQGILHKREEVLHGSPDSIMPPQEAVIRDFFSRDLGTRICCDESMVTRLLDKISEVDND